MIPAELRDSFRDAILSQFVFECPDCPSTVTLAIHGTENTTVGVITMHHQSTCPVPYAVVQATVTFAEKAPGGSMSVEQGPPY